MGRRDTVLSHSGVSLGPEGWTAVLSGGRGHGRAQELVQRGKHLGVNCTVGIGARISGPELPLVPQAAGCREARRPRAGFPSHPSVHGQELALGAGAKPTATQEPQT